MKDTILRFLNNGVVYTKKYSLDDLIKRFYPLKKIAEYNPEKQAITFKKNAFWDVENFKNRFELIDDISKSKSGIKGMFSILNRYENGDRYGIA